jgi:hypothetical protein
MSIGKYTNNKAIMRIENAAPCICVPKRDRK